MFVKVLVDAHLPLQQGQLFFSGSGRSGIAGRREGYVYVGLLLVEAVGVGSGGPNWPAQDLLGAGLARGEYLLWGMGLERVLGATFIFLLVPEVVVQRQGGLVVALGAGLAASAVGQVERRLVGEQMGRGPQLTRAHCGSGNHFNYRRE